MSDHDIKEGWIKKGGVNNPPQTPRPPAPQAMKPVTSPWNQDMSKVPTAGWVLYMDTRGHIFTEFGASSREAIAWAEIRKLEIES